VKNINYSQKEKAEQFYRLHHSGKLLILPNIWDILGARLLEDLGYPALATASASIAFTNGFNDGEKMPFVELLPLLKKITGSVTLPVSADIESGYSHNQAALQENIRLLLNAGIVGINIEDSNPATNNLFDINTQCERIKTIRSVADDSGIPLFINARTDVLIHTAEISTPINRFDELLKRGLAYKNAGADCFYPITLKHQEEIEKLVSYLKMPVNILTIPGIPDLATLYKIGVTRLSLGPSFLKIAIKSMKDLAMNLKENKGLNTITENEITTDYLKMLITP